MNNLTTWNKIKEAADYSVEGLARIALNLWANNDYGTKLSHDKAHREAFVASLVGALITDNAIEKLSSEKKLSILEANYLSALNADSAMNDLSEFAKSAGVLDWVKANPAITGTVVGGAIGAGTGAFIDDDDRLRGAIRFGIPGAVFGGLIGKGYSQLTSENLALSEQEKQRKELHDARLQELNKRVEQGNEMHNIRKDMEQARKLQIEKDLALRELQHKQRFDQGNEMHNIRKDMEQARKLQIEKDLALREAQHRQREQLAQQQALQQAAISEKRLKNERLNILKNKAQKAMMEQQEINKWKEHQVDLAKKELERTLSAERLQDYLNRTNRP